jgi:ribosomal protein L7/L12
MRIRIWNAFASNNSGSYTIVGSFPSEAAATELADALAAAVSAHDAFVRAKDEPRAGEPPFHRFVRGQGLTVDDPQLALGDDWPAWGPAPRVLAVGAQVLVHVDQTITMPRALGELFYRRGGRVEVEIDHAHDPVLTVFELWVRDAWKEERRDDAKARLAAFQQALAGLLPALLEWPGWPPRKAVEPAWDLDRFVVRLGVVFPDLVRGVAEVMRVAREHGVTARVRVQEALAPSADPLAFMRGRREREPGPWQALLWDPREARVPVLKALREIAELTLAEAQALLAEAPCVVLEHASREDAEAAAAKLVAAGADAEAVQPRSRWWPEA